MHRAATAGKPHPSGTVAKPMQTLLIDTSCDALVAAVAAGDDLCVARVVCGRRAQALLDVVDEVLCEAGLDVADLDRIGVGIGPGGFTGLRVGVATARGLAAALDLPLAGLGSLESVAAVLHGEGGGAWASIDARRGERFLQRFECGTDDGVVADGGLLVVAAADVAGIVCGDTLIEGPPSAQGLLASAMRAQFGDCSLVVPLYGRNPDAVPMAERVVQA